MKSPWIKFNFIAASGTALVILSGCGSTVTPVKSANNNQNGTYIPSYDYDPSIDGGDDLPADVPTQVITVEQPWANARMATGETHSCAINGAGAILCWGRNQSGQVGDGTTTDRKKFVKLANPASVQMVAAGGDHSCALDSSRSVWCWGANESGQVGDNTTAAKNAPVQISQLGTGVKALAVGFAHTCAIDGLGKVWCWGKNDRGQLGNASNSNSLVPVSVRAFTGGAQAISAGNSHTCVTDGNGALSCWGNNIYGRLGDGSTDHKNTPTPVANLTSGVLSVSAGGAHTCAVTNVGHLYCWGNNASGQLGTGGAASTTPVRVTGISVVPKLIAAGGYHTCVTDLGGSVVQCWGYNRNGQVGNGATLNSSTANVSTPTNVLNTSGTIRSLATGGYHSCAHDGTGIRCWGNDYYGQLGLDWNNADQSYAFNVSGLGAP